MLGIRGATMTQDDVMEIEGESVAASMETGDTSRAGIGMKADVSGGYSEAGQVPQALKAEGAGLVRPEVQPLIHQPVRWRLDSENHAFRKLVAFPDSFPCVPNYLVNMLQSCTETELMDLFSRFMHHPLSEAVVRRILETYIPMKASCQQEVTWTVNVQKGTSTAGLGSVDLRA